MAKRMWSSNVLGYDIYLADNKDGCLTVYNGEGSSLERKVELYGKCLSKCRLGQTLATYYSLINNKGYTARNVDELKEPTVV